MKIIKGVMLVILVLLLNANCIYAGTSNKIIFFEDYPGASYNDIPTSCFITENNDLYVWGCNSNGQVGNGTQTDVENPNLILKNVKYVDSIGFWEDNNKVCFGFCAISKDGGFYFWGYPTDSGYQLSPVKVSDNVKSLFRSIDSYYVTKTDNSLWEYDVDKIKFVKKICSDVKSFRIWEHYSEEQSPKTIFVIKNDNSLWASGSNNVGQIGNGNKKYQKKFIKVLNNVDKLYMNGYDSISASIYAIKKDKSLWSWGYNDEGQLGNGTFKTCLKPAMVLKNVKSFKRSWYERIQALDTSSRLWSWGYGKDGFIGNGKKVNVSKPVIIAKGVKQFGHNFIIRNDSTFWKWGKYVGDGTKNMVLKPKKIASNVKRYLDWPEYFQIIKNDNSLLVWDRKKLKPYKIADNVLYSIGEEAVLNNGDLIRFNSKWKTKKITEGVVQTFNGLEGNFYVKNDGNLYFRKDNENSVNLLFNLTP